MAQFSFGTDGARVKVKKGVHGAGREGVFYVAIHNERQWWAVVQFDGREDPETFKVACLLVKKHDDKRFHDLSGYF